jgi:plastocyanin
VVQHSKHCVMAIMFASGALAGASQSPDAMAETREVEIITDANGKSVFKDPEIEIKDGDTVRWVAKVGDHHLKGDSPSDAFEETEDFSTNAPVEQAFKTPGTVKYHCIFHPGTMRGTITVK